MLTRTGTRTGSPGDGAGATAWHTDMLGQLTGAWMGPNITVMVPLALNRPRPVMVTVVPAGPEVGVILSPPGGPVGKVAGGADAARDGLGADAAPAPDGVDADRAPVAGALATEVGGGPVVAGAVVAGEVVAGATELGTVATVEVWTFVVPEVATTTRRATSIAAPRATSPPTAVRPRCRVDQICGSSSGRPGGATAGAGLVSSVPPRGAAPRMPGGGGGGATQPRPADP